MAIHSVMFREAVRVSNEEKGYVDSARYDIEQVLKDRVFYVVKKTGGKATVIPFENIKSWEEDAEDSKRGKKPSPTGA